MVSGTSEGVPLKFLDIWLGAPPPAPLQDGGCATESTLVCSMPPLLQMIVLGFAEPGKDKRT